MSVYDEDSLGGLFNSLKKRVTMLKCAECGKEIMQTRKWQRFCSSVCRDSWHANEKERRIAELEAEVERLRARVAELERTG